MNLQYLFEIQAGLDAHIEEEHPELKGQDNLDWKILALQVELGECANEWRGFKKWSKDQEPRIFEPNPNDVCEECKGQPIFYNEDKSKIIGQCDNCDGCGVHFHNPLLEEYVDCLHFILSIGLELGADKFLNSSVDWSYMDEKDVVKLFSNLFVINWDILNDNDYFDYFEGFEYFMTLGRELGFTLKQVEQAYLVKNKINHQRQENGY